MIECISDEELWYVFTGSKSVPYKLREDNPDKKHFCRKLETIKPGLEDKIQLAKKITLNPPNEPPCVESVPLYGFYLLEILWVLRWIEGDKCVECSKIKPAFLRALERNDMATQVELKFIHGKSFLDTVEYDIVGKGYVDHSYSQEFQYDEERNCDEVCIVHYLDLTRSGLQKAKKIITSIDNLFIEKQAIRENATDMQAVTANDERDKRIYELACDTTLTWSDIIDVINLKFPDAMISKDAAQKAAKRYQEKNGLEQMPSRPTGRRSTH